jgi:Spy/CpxP family protein refolding chaperone
MKSPFIVMLAAALLAGSTLPSAAQPNKAKQQRPAMGQGGPGGPGGDEGVSEEQKEKLQAAMKAEREVMKPLQRDLRDAVTKLSDLIEDGAADSELQAGMDRVEKAQKAIEAQREKSQAQIKAMMPIKQRAMMMVRMAQGMGQMRGGMQQRMGQGAGQGRMGQGMGPGRMGMGQGMGGGMRGRGMDSDGNDGPEDDQP